MVEQPAKPIALADTVGAGDSFTAGSLDGVAGAGPLGRETGRLAAVDEATLHRSADQS